MSGDRVEGAAGDLAQVNIARLREPLASERLAPFVAGLEPVNASAEAAPGFLWRLQDEAGNATSIPGFAWDRADSAGVIVNLSTWRSVEDLKAWIHADLHRGFLRRRGEWFEPVTEATVALWWVPPGHRPTVAEAEARIRLLRRLGPSLDAFTLRTPFPCPPTRHPTA